LKLSKEIKTGTLVILGIVLFVFGFNYLKGENLLDSSRTFFTEYENVEGLMPSTPVTINGKGVGKVQEIYFKEDGSGKLVVKLMVDSDFKFSKNSRAELYEAGLIGGKAVAIVPAYDNAELAKDQSYLQGTIKAGLSELLNQKLTPLQGKIEAMMVSADSLLQNLNDVFDAKAKANLKTSIAGLSATLESFKGTSISLNQIVAGNQEKISSVLTNADKSLANLSSITNSLSETDLGKTVKELDGSLKNFNQILASIENGEGTMGKLINDDALYNNLKGASKEMEELLEDIKLHPKRYFRILSKKEIPYNSEETNE
jgi:phospholipid/cholesterol/gamma-HCH transport system substrate-binding protein